MGFSNPLKRTWWFSSTFPAVKNGSFAFGEGRPKGLPKPDVPLRGIGVWMKLTLMPE